MKNFIKGRDNLACTIFIPVKCGNNCPFCTSKQMYDDFVYDPVYLFNIKSWIRLINQNDFVSEFVITGGEPLFNIDILSEIVYTCKKPVFINTSLPKVKDIDRVIRFINNTPIIKGINISRHINYRHDVPTYGLDIMKRITKPIRINTIVNPETFSINTVEALLNTYNSNNMMINLRADYRTITDENLKTRDSIFTELLDNYSYQGSSSCLVCNSSFFKTDYNLVICYHRGIEISSVKTKRGTIVNDIIIDMLGTIYKDWDMNFDIDFADFISLYSNYLDYNDVQIVKAKEEASKKIDTKIIKSVTTGCGMVFGGGGCGVTPNKRKKKTTSCGAVINQGCGNIGCGSPGPIIYQGCFTRSCGGSGC